MGNYNILMTTKRIETLVDGVFAIAMTLLVLSLNVPQLTYPTTDFAIINSFFAMFHQFFIYFMSFILLALFWRINHTQFYFIKKVNQTLLWINIIWLSLIALIPFSTNLVGCYGYLKVPIIFFDLNLFFIGVLFSLNWYYANKKNLLDKNANKKMVKSRNKTGLALPSLALVAIALTFISPEWSSLVYFTLFFIKG
ncbi:MAG: TMEM175 family protein [Methanobacterium sp.]|nr:TMEM175 family protein [Methanobacterium sp.]